MFGHVEGAGAKFGESISGVTANLGPFGVELDWGHRRGACARRCDGGVGGGGGCCDGQCVGRSSSRRRGAARSPSLCAGPAVALAIAVFGCGSRRCPSCQGPTPGTASRPGSEHRRHQGGGLPRTGAHHNALVALASALRGQASAERGLEDAKKCAHDAIVQAARDEATAAQNVSDATNNEKEQLVAAYQAIKELPSNGLRKRSLSFESAQLGIKESAAGAWTRLSWRSRSSAPSRASPVNSSTTSRKGLRTLTLTSTSDPYGRANTGRGYG